MGGQILEDGHGLDGWFLGHDGRGIYHERHGHKYHERHGTYVCSRTSADGAAHARADIFADFVQ